MHIEKSRNKLKNLCSDHQPDHQEKKMKKDLDFPLPMMYMYVPLTTDKKEGRCFPKCSLDISS